MSIFIHSQSDVQTKNIGDDTNIWQYCVILPDAIIGKNCNICAHVLIENNVTVGNNVTIKSGVQLWDGIRINDNVFIGPNVTFTNDPFPRSKMHPEKYIETIIDYRASIGANATILCGITIGKYALIGAGSVVTKNIPSNTLWYGNPAVHKGYITNDGIVLDLKFVDKTGKKHNIIAI